MYAPTIERILSDVLRFLSQGEEFVRKYPRKQFSVLIKSAVMAGVDVEGVLSAVLNDLYSIQRGINKLKRIWVMLLARCILILIGVILVRVGLLHAIDPSVWIVWTRTDRLLLVLALFLAMFLGGILISRSVAQGWGPYRQSMLWDNFCDYVTMGRGQIRCATLRRSIKKITLDEWRTGASGHSARSVLLKSRVNAIGDDVAKECIMLASITAGAELSIFTIGFMGFNFAPLMAWMESASGIN